jgi:translation elongation factor EF-G
MVDHCFAFAEVTVGPLYMLMGRHLEAATAVPAGSVCGIGGLSSHIHRSGTLASDPDVPPFINLR